jgi:hypothetical protein
MWLVLAIKGFASELDVSVQFYIPTALLPKKEPLMNVDGTQPEDVSKERIPTASNRIPILILI